MNKEKIYQKINTILHDVSSFVVIQADNPDGDSLASSLALEQILGNMGKDVTLYCSVDMPNYLKHLPGWDRVTSEMPTKFDATIIVDTSTITLLEKIVSSGQHNWIASRPCIVFDHHVQTNNEISFATALLNDPSSSSTGELIYEISKELNWPLDTISGELLTNAVLSDTQGLTNDLASANTYRMLADLIENGVDRPKLEEARRKLSRMDPKIFKYKALLIERTEFLLDGVLAYVEITQKEISEYSPLYNPAPLIQPDMLQTEGVGIAIVVKQYDNGKITGAIRCNPGFGFAEKIAEHIGGGGHNYAAGFKSIGSKNILEIKKDCLEVVSGLISNTEKK